MHLNTKFIHGDEPSFRHVSIWPSKISVYRLRDCIFDHQISINAIGSSTIYCYCVINNHGFFSESEFFFRAQRAIFFILSTRSDIFVFFSNLILFYYFIIFIIKNPGSDYFFIPIPAKLFFSSKFRIKLCFQQKKWCSPLQVKWSVCL